MNSFFLIDEKTDFDVSDDDVDMMTFDHTKDFDTLDLDSSRSRAVEAKRKRAERKTAILAQRLSVYEYTITRIWRSTNIRAQECNGTRVYDNTSM